MGQPKNVFLSRILYSNICGIKFYSTSVTEYIPYCPILNECFYILLQSITLTTRHKLQCGFFKILQFTTRNRKLSDLFLSLLLEQFTAEYKRVPCFLLIFRPMCVIQNNTKVKHTIATNFYLYLLHICTLPMQ